MTKQQARHGGAILAARAVGKIEAKVRRRRGRGGDRSRRNWKTGPSGCTRAETTSQKSRGCPSSAAAGSLHPASVSQCGRRERVSISRSRASGIRNSPASCGDHEKTEAKTSASEEIRYASETRGKHAIRSPPFPPLTAVRARIDRSM